MIKWPRRLDRNHLIRIVNRKTHFKKLTNKQNKAFILPFLIPWGITNDWQRRGPQRRIPENKSRNIPIDSENHASTLSEIIHITSVHFWMLKPFSSVTSSCPTLATPWIAAFQASMSITNPQKLLNLMSIKLVMPSNHLILCRPVLLLPSIFPSIRVFLNDTMYQFGAAGSGRSWAWGS